MTRTPGLLQWVVHVESFKLITRAGFPNPGSLQRVEFQSLEARHEVRSLRRIEGHARCRFMKKSTLVLLGVVALCIIGLVIWKSSRTRPVKDQPLVVAPDVSAEPPAVVVAPETQKEAPAEDLPVTPVVVSETPKDSPSEFTPVPVEPQIVRKKAFFKLPTAGEMTPARSTDLDFKQLTGANGLLVFEEKPFTGVAIKMDRNGHRRGRYEYVDGKLDGTSQEAYINGAISVLSQYARGLRHGTNDFFGEDGQFVRRQIWVNDRLVDNFERQDVEETAQ